MPAYTYRCDKCELKVDVIRSVSEYDQLPSSEDDKSIETGCDHLWARFFGEAPRTVRMPRWGSKGNWSKEPWE